MTFINKLRFTSPQQINKADVTKLIPRLRIPVDEYTKRLKNPAGPEGRLLKLRKTVTALFKYERIELNYPRAEEARGYAELLLSQAIRHGPQHEETMEVADYWVLEKQLVHKLFKVLVPRFQYTSTAYTKLYRAPTWTWSDGFHPEADRDQYDREVTRPPSFDRQVKYQKALLELIGNPFPPLYFNRYSNPKYLHNVLLTSARKEHKINSTHHSSQDSSSSSSDDGLQAELSENVNKDTVEGESVSKQRD